MIIKKIKALINEFQVRERFIEGQSRELEWADVFRDTIKGRKWLEDLPLSPGRWAGNYSLFYILTRILSDYQPKTILEFGLGESSKLISTFLKNELITSRHVIIEHDMDWIEAFLKRFSLTPNSSIVHRKSIVKSIHQFESNSYDNLEAYSEQIMDLYLVDGISSNRFSRNYIVKMFEKADKKNEFIVIIDDYGRAGEQDTANELIDTLNKKSVKTYKGFYSGNKSQIVIATEKYRFSTSL